eukprot:3873389-Rhodomonas_salina.1
MDETPTSYASARNSYIAGNSCPGTQDLSQCPIFLHTVPGYRYGYPCQTMRTRAEEILRLPGYPVRNVARKGSDWCPFIKARLKPRIGKLIQGPGCVSSNLWV